QSQANAAPDPEWPLDAGDVARDPLAGYLDLNVMCAAAAFMVSLHLPDELLDVENHDCFQFTNVSKGAITFNAAAAFLRQWADAAAEALETHLRRSGVPYPAERNARRLAAWK